MALKTIVGDRLWLISQPDHAAVSGYLAARWGNAEFVPPGHYRPSSNPERLRAETVLAIAEHDNGWWEWEADPQIDPRDGLPLHLTGMSQQDGFERWRLGVPRFEREHPYVALLISLHAFWLHAPRVRHDADATFLHPLFGSPGSLLDDKPETLAGARSFVDAQEATQQRLIQRLRGPEKWPEAVEKPTLSAHVRLLQLMDALSLALCFGANKPLRLPGIPRACWDDRVTLEAEPAGERKLALRPYPFSEPRIAVPVRARVLPVSGREPNSQETFYARWHAVPRTHLSFEFLPG